MEKLLSFSGIKGEVLMVLHLQTRWGTSYNLLKRMTFIIQTYIWTTYICLKFLLN